MSLNCKVTVSNITHFFRPPLHCHSTPQRATVNSRPPQRSGRQHPFLWGLYLAPTLLLSLSQGIDPTPNFPYYEIKGQLRDLQLLSWAARGTSSVNSRARRPGRVKDPHFSYKVAEGKVTTMSSFKEPLLWAFFYLVSHLTLGPFYKWGA